jgi:hypothetical protein
MTGTMDDARTYSGTVRSLERQGGPDAVRLTFWIDNVGQVETAEALCRGLREGDRVTVRGRLDRESILVADAVQLVAAPQPRRSWWRIVKIVAAFVLPLPILLLMIWGIVVFNAVFGAFVWYAILLVVAVILIGAMIGLGKVILGARKRR